MHSATRNSRLQMQITLTETDCEINLQQILFNPVDIRFSPDSCLWSCNNQLMWRGFKGIGEIAKKVNVDGGLLNRVVIPSWLKPKSGRFRTGDSIMDITQRQFSFMLG